MKIPFLSQSGDQPAAQPPITPPWHPSAEDYVRIPTPVPADLPEMLLPFIGAIGQVEKVHTQTYSFMKDIKPGDFLTVIYLSDEVEEGTESTPRYFHTNKKWFERITGDELSPDLAARFGALDEGEDEETDEAEQEPPQETPHGINLEEVARNLDDPSKPLITDAVGKKPADIDK